jgi:hypothetical protein
LGFAATEKKFFLRWQLFIFPGRMLENLPRRNCIFPMKIVSRVRSFEAAEIAGEKAAVEVYFPGEIPAGTILI